MGYSKMREASANKSFADFRAAIEARVELQPSW